MKKVACLLMVLLSIFLVSFSATAAGSETSLDTGDRNILFSNGYRGFCLDVKLKGAYTGDTFTPAENTSVATNNNGSGNISQLLKVLFTQCFEDIFVSDGNSNYTIENTNTIQAVVWHFSDNQYVWGDQLKLVNAVKAYTGPEIPDHDYKLTLDNGDTITFYFTVMMTQSENQQDFFAYKIKVDKEAPHSHVYGQKWENDANNHWHECECGDKIEQAPHTGTTADCVNPSVCEVCQKELAGKNPNNHTGNTVVKVQLDPEEFKEGYTGDTYCKDCETLLIKGSTIPATHSHTYGQKWESDANNHWHECECGDKIEQAPHTGTTADCVNPSVCEVCQKELAGKNPDSHTGNTVVKDQLDPEEFKEGYTGDTYCEDCGTLLIKGYILPAMHSHVYGLEWKIDAYSHWHECECGDKPTPQKHTYEDGNCIVCGAVDPDQTEMLPNTSNRSHIYLWIALLLLSMVAFGVMSEQLLSKKGDCITRKTGRKSLARKMLKM